MNGACVSVCVDVDTRFTVSHSFLNIEQWESSSVDHYLWFVFIEVELDEFHLQTIYCAGRFLSEKLTN